MFLFLNITFFLAPGQTGMIVVFKFLTLNWTFFFKEKKKLLNWI